MAQRSSNQLPARFRKNRSFGGYALLGAAIIAAAFIVRANPKAAEAARAPDSPRVVAQFDTVQLPVPVRPVPPGTPLDKISFTQVAFPKHQIPAGAVTNLETLRGSVTIAALPARLPIFMENFSSTARLHNPVVEQIPAGMRAMTVRVDATSAVEGWAGSGSIVDVLLVSEGRTTVIAERVRVLSSERSTSPVDGASAPAVPSTVTLLVTQEQCLAINTAIPMGKIAFALRGFSDGDSWSITRYNSERLKGGPGNSNGRAAVTGYAAVKGADTESQFALTDGKWVRTRVVPQGFFPNKDQADNAKD